jgi:hypothetical protein
MPSREEVERAIEAIFAESDFQQAGLRQRHALKLLDQGVWEGTVTPFYQARAEQRINGYIRTLWDAVSEQRVLDPTE